MDKEPALDEVEGIGPITLKKLSAAGITTVKELAFMPPRLIAEIAEIPESRALQISLNARKLIERFFITANEIKAIEKKKPLLTTGVTSLDNILLGGIEGGTIIELAGEYGSGKTQLCHQLAVTVQFPIGKGGLDGSALYIDTENTFSYLRVENIARRFNLDPDKVLEKIIVAKAFNTEHQIYIVQEARSKVKEYNIKLIIVDSIINHFRSEYTGRETLALRQQKLNSHMHDLMRLAEIFMIPVIITNQIVSSPDTFIQSKHPAGGNVIAHISSIRIMLEKQRNNVRIAHIIDSPKHPLSSASFIITEQGVEDTINVQPNKNEDNQKR
ncbi:MAG: DNA repair and recombination protein RadA [Thermoprotei archaeon]